jgi:hypothetical protein
VQVTFVEGVREDVAGLVASSTADDKISESEVEALKRRIRATRTPKATQRSRRGT